MRLAQLARSGVLAPSGDDGATGPMPVATLTHHCSNVGMVTAVWPDFPGAAMQNTLPYTGAMVFPAGTVTPNTVILIEASVRTASSFIPGDTDATTTCAGSQGDLLDAVPLQAGYVTAILREMVGIPVMQPA